MTFYYSKEGAREPLLALRCDCCSFCIFTEREGQEFPEHYTEDAKPKGWRAVSINNKWVHLCPDCYAKREEIKNNSYEKIREKRIYDFI